MKMLFFVISLGVLYWVMASYAHMRLSAGEGCGEAAAEAVASAPAGEAAICVDYAATS